MQVAHGVRALVGDWGPLRRVRPGQTGGEDDGRHGRDPASRGGDGVAGALSDIDELFGLFGPLGAVGAQEEQNHGVDGETETDVSGGEEVFLCVVVVGVHLVEEWHLHQLEECLGELFLRWLQAHEDWL